MVLCPQPTRLVQSIPSIAALYWQEMSDAFILVLCQFHAPMITLQTQ